EVNGFPGFDVSTDKRLLDFIAWDSRDWARALLGVLLLDSCPSTLEGTIDAGRRRVEESGDFAGRPAEDVAQDQHRPLAGRQQLDYGEKGEVYAFTQVIVRHGVPGCGLQLIQQLVWIG